MRADQSLPIRFEANLGQADSRAKFIARGKGFTLFLTPTEAVLSLRKHRSAFPEASDKRTPGITTLAATARRGGMFPDIAAEVLRPKIVDANPQCRVDGLGPLPGRSNYFIGNHPEKWRTNGPAYARVRYRDVCPGLT